MLFRSKTPIQCRHCEEAPCALVCPTGAISQENGMVYLNRAACFGCKGCSMVCPFGAIRIRAEIKVVGDRRTKRAKALKCDLCVDDATGEVREEACACIKACPTKAITLVDSDELRLRVMAARAKEMARAYAVENREKN